MSAFDSNSLVVFAEQEPGVVIFHNYEALKAELERGLVYYNSFEYSIVCRKVANKITQR